LIFNANNNVKQKRYNDAITLYKKALIYEPNNCKIIFNIAVNYLYQESYFNSIEYFHKAIKIDKNYLKAYINLGIAYKKNLRYTKALEIFNIALQLDTKDIDIYYNIANTYLALENHTLAIKYFTITLQIDNNNFKAYYGLGLVYNHQTKYDIAMKYFEKALSIKSNYSDAIFAKSLIQLRNKDYTNGWKNYESRFDANNALKKLSYDIPFYTGQNIKDKTILIQEEQGYGDNIQFIRYVEFIKKQQPKMIYIALRKELARLFRFIDGVTIVNNNDTLYDIDFIASLLSIPYISNTTFTNIPNNTPYLQLQKQDKININIIQNTTKLKVGFAYSGNKDHPNDKYRSIALEIFKDIFTLQNIEFYNLQVSNENNDLDDMIKNTNNIFDCTPYINDFYDTALILDKLDIIISIDSALVHLAGAYHKKSFLLLPQNAEWRWFENINYSPWYPSIRLFRQKELGLWIDVIDEVKEELSFLAKG
jgi:tetratricopeptide (TPR) repeat protein